MLKKEFTLRPYQQELINNLSVAVKQHRRVIAYAVTGAGKSKTFLRICVNAINKGYTTLVITESRKIYKQLIAEVHAVEIKPGSKLAVITPGSVYLAMAQTLRRRKHLIDQFKLISEKHAHYQKPGIINNGLLIINDECHINQATGILEQLPTALLIGFSGSPVGKHLVNLYNHLVVGPQPHELVLSGFLTPYRHFERQRADISQLQLDGSGEYTEESQEQVFSTDAVYDGICDDLRKCNFKKALIFTSSIHHCELTAERLRQEGFKCVTVHSGLKGQEEFNLFQFTHGLMPICVSVGILTKGFDFPAIDFIGILRKTTSLALYLQMIGRASRVLPGEEFVPIGQRKKQVFCVYDYGQNCKKHFPWDYERDWQELWRGKPKKEGVSPIKRCPQCDYINKARATICEMCGYVWLIMNSDEPEQPSPETILIEVNAKYNKLVGKKISELTPEELAIYAKSKNQKQYAIRVAKWHCFFKGMGKDQPGRQFMYDYSIQMGYNRYWVKIQIDAMRAVLQSNPNEKFEFHDKILR